MYCSNRNASEVCQSNKNFTFSDIITRVDTPNLIRFVVLNPATTNPISSNDVQETISGNFTSNIFKIRLSIAASPTTAPPTSGSSSTPQPPQPDPNLANAISIILKNFTAREWGTIDLVFRQKMAEQINVFCVEETICHPTLPKGINITAKNIERLPNSPFQVGNNANLSFYVKIPPTNESLPKDLLTTIFTEKQDEILAVLPGVLIESPPVDLPRQILSPEQKNNTVRLTIFDRDVSKITLLVIVEIRTAMVQRMNMFCFGTDGDVCQLQSNLRRKKREATGQRFNESDITFDTDSIASDEGSTGLGIGVNKPGTTEPVKKTVLQDALSTPLQTKNLRLAVLEAVRNLTSHQNTMAMTMMTTITIMTTTTTMKTPTITKPTMTTPTMATPTMKTPTMATPTMTTPMATDDDVDLPLILGLSIGGLLLFVFVIVSIIYYKTKVRVHGNLTFQGVKE
ncbi:uncharacterized protein LOC124445700 [Xenia sp. Carnegie-2017]|uniref:uncharacterized protein LOC124445700 n=1 Tax=Xenia sp. Carnegie-2017 TaxID=2897299 RepID=UPI001F03C899|nr:uncharacterized protein LOC124445700 [Xenia sp. Carnegie-2017]